MSISSYMKKIFSVIGFACLGVFSYAGVNFELDGLTFKPIENESKCVITYPDQGVYTGNIEIPSIVNFGGERLVVVGIDEYAFAGSTDVVGVRIPNTITSIGRNAFQGCTGLREILLPSSVKKLPDQLFYGCTSLLKFSGKGVMEIGVSCFSNCTSLSNPEFSNGVTSIGDGAFRNCRALTEMEFSNLNIIGSSVFAGCSQLKTVTLGDAIEIIPDHVFSGCMALTEIDGASRATEVGDYAFYTCTSLVAFNFPNSIRRIGENAFGFCETLKEAKILTESEALIEDYAFSCCYGLEYVECENVTEIGEEAFAKDSSLKTVILDKAIKYINGRAFRDCHNIENFYCMAQEPPITENNTFDNVTYDTAILKVRGDKVIQYRHSPPWSYFKKITSVEDNGVSTHPLAVERLQLTVYDGALIVKGEPGLLRVFNLRGELIMEKEKGIEDIVLPMLGKGIYLVSLNGETRKTVL